MKSSMLYAYTSINDHFMQYAYLRLKSWHWWSSLDPHNELGHSFHHIVWQETNKLITNSISTWRCVLTIDRWLLENLRAKPRKWCTLELIALRTLSLPKSDPSKEMVTGWDGSVIICFPKIIPVLGGYVCFFFSSSLYYH